MSDTKPTAGYGRLSFSEQIDFFRRKVPLPSESWTQLYTSGHDHGFVVAGATREALVLDLQKSVDQVLSEGKSLESFRRDFDQIVADHGWDHNGSRNWRSKVIYETNLFTSFAAGRREQLLSMTQTHPYWMYVHSDAVKHPRPEHQALDGMVLRWDDPFWQTHFPPNGWGCQCEVRALSKRQAIKTGKIRDDGSVIDQAPPIKMREVTIGKNGPAPRTVRVPEGIDPGFEYAPGATVKNDWLGQRADQAMRNAPDLATNAWSPVLTKGPADFGRPPMLPLATPPVALAPRLAAGESMVQRVHEALGAPVRTFDVRGLPVVVSANALGAHLAADPGRAVYLPYLVDMLTNPWEVWLNLFRNQATGAYELRSRIVKGYALGDGSGVLMVAQVGAGFFEGWTFLPTKNLKYLNKQRQGQLWYGQDE